MIPGEVLVAAGEVTLFASAGPTTRLTVLNTGDRPVQVGSHFHLAEANEALSMDRAAARGRRLAVPAGTAVRFEPGIESEVTLVPLAGRRVVAGLRGLVAGPLDEPDGTPFPTTSEAPGQGGGGPARPGGRVQGAVADGGKS